MTSKINTDACDWIAKLHGGEPTEDELAELRAWMAERPEHKAELRRMATLWGDLNVLTELAVPTPAARPRRFSWRMQRYAAGAAVLMISLLGTLVWWQQQELGMHTTTVGEQRDIELNDGSSVLLNTDSRIRVEYSDDLREIYLVRGEALFDVASDSERPFQVYAGNGLVHALGTRFAVRLKRSNVEVTVTEGAVNVVKAGTPVAVVNNAEHSASIVAAGQSAIFDQALASVTSITVIEQPELARKLAWQHGQLRFAGDRLEVVVDEVSRYTSLSIVILDAKLRDQRIGAVFDAGDTQRMLNTLERSYGVRVAYIDDNLVHLSSADSKERAP